MYLKSCEYDRLIRTELGASLQKLSEILSSIWMANCPKGTGQRNKSLYNIFAVQDLRDQIFETEDVQNLRFSISGFRSGRFSKSWIFDIFDIRDFRCLRCPNHNLVSCPVAARKVRRARTRKHQTYCYQTSPPSPAVSSG